MPRGPNLRGTGDPQRRDLPDNVLVGDVGLRRPAQHAELVLLEKRVIAQHLVKNGKKDLLPDSFTQYLPDAKPDKKTPDASTPVDTVTTTALARSDPSFVTT